MELKQIKEAGQELDNKISEYYKMVFAYYGLPRDTCSLEGTIHEQAKQFKKRFNLDVIEKQIMSQIDGE